MGLGNIRHPAGKFSGRHGMNILTINQNRTGTRLHQTQDTPEKGTFTYAVWT